MKLFGVYAGYLLYLEMVYHLGCFGFSAGNPVFALPLIMALAGAETFITGSLPEKWKKRMFFCFLWAEAVLFAAQCVYLGIFRQPLLLEAAFRGGQDALTNYWREALDGILKALPLLIVLILPPILLGVLIHRKKPDFPVFHGIEKLRSMLLTGVGLICCVTALAIGSAVGADFYDDYAEFYDPLTVAEDMGVLTMAQRDIQKSLTDGAGSLWSKLTADGELPGTKPGGQAEGSAAPSDDTATAGNVESSENPQNSDGPDGTPATDREGQGGEAADPSGKEPEERLPDTSPNRLPIDTALLRAQADSKETVWLAEYLEGLTPTRRNEYTGIFEGYNLIYLTAEGFSPYAVREDLTPTLYRLLHSGFIFDNYYVPLWQTSTSDGEYINCTGLIPDGQFSMRKSAANDMAYTLPRFFEQEGVKSLAYHNNSLSYYDRYLTHPNLGYDFKGAKLGECEEEEWGDKIFPMENPDAWPASDLEMVQGTVPEYINSERFHVYYMTVSGHMNYDFKGNAMSGKNKEAVAGLDMSENARAYIACNMELDKALGYLLEQLEAAGKLENTVICMSADHYPYGMTQTQYEELAGKPLSENLDLYRNSLILWNAGMEAEPVHVEKVCGSMDIIPTLLNLFGFEFDSRLYAGRDIFSDGEGMVIFNDRSFITDTVIYNKKGKSTVWKEDLAAAQPEEGQAGDGGPEGMTEEWTDEAQTGDSGPKGMTEEEREAYLSAKKQEVKSRYQFSAFILQKDYYRQIRESLALGSAGE